MLGGKISCSGNANAVFVTHNTLEMIRKVSNPSAQHSGIFVMFCTLITATVTVTLPERKPSPFCQPHSTPQHISPQIMTCKKSLERWLSIGQTTMKFGWMDGKIW